MIPITGVLVAEHRMFCSVFDQIEEILPTVSSLVKIKRLTRLVEGLLLSHAKAEDDLLQLLGKHGRQDNGRYARMRKEHQEVDARITRVYLTNKVDVARGLLSAALAASRRHFSREERLVFPLIQKVVAPEILARLGTIWFMRKHVPANWSL
jgi:iron-sulfur cluster repair protein YtfE (RIC family)